MNLTKERSKVMEVKQYRGSKDTAPYENLTMKFSKIENGNIQCLLKQATLGALHALSE